MTLEKAKRIQYLRCGPVMHSWRRISEIICEEFPDENKDMSGNQLHGKYNLCYTAMELLSGVKDIRDVPEAVREEWDT